MLLDNLTKMLRASNTAFIRELMTVSSVDDLDGVGAGAGRRVAL